MDKQLLRLISILMFISAAAFVGFAFLHPEMSWPWSNAVTYILYGIYIAVMAVLFIVSLEKLQKKTRIVLVVLVVLLVLAVDAVCVFPYVTGPEYLYMQF